MLYMYESINFFQETIVKAARNDTNVKQTRRMSSSSSSGRCTRINRDREHRKVVKKKYKETSDNKPITQPTMTTPATRLSDNSEYRPSIAEYDHASLDMLQQSAGADEPHTLARLDDHSDDTAEAVSMDTPVSDDDVSADDDGDDNDISVDNIYMYDSDGDELSVDDDVSSSSSSSISGGGGGGDGGGAGCAAAGSVDRTSAQRKRQQNAGESLRCER